MRKSNHASSKEQAVPSSGHDAPAQRKPEQVVQSILGPGWYQRAHQDLHSLSHAEVQFLQRSIGNRAMNQVLQMSSQRSAPTGMPSNQSQTAQQSPTPRNKTGLPDKLKAGIENLSGISLDDVHVHSHSSKPAEVQALAYTQGNEIHVGPGQEQHLPHETWHVVQQKQGRVKPTARAGQVAINDDQELEREADAMGAKAAEGLAPPNNSKRVSSISSPSPSPIQGVFTYRGKLLSNDSEEIQAIQAYLSKAKYTKQRKDFEKILSGKKEVRLADWVPSNFGVDVSVKKIVENWQEEASTGKVTKRKRVKSKKVVEEEEVQSKSEEESESEEPPKQLNKIAEDIHLGAKGDPSKSTTGVGRLGDGSFVVATQLALDTVRKAALRLYNIPADRVYKTYGAGYHTEVSLFIDYKKQLKAVGASQGFCPDCQKFLADKGIAMEGSARTTPDQVWYSPEHYSNKEKPANASYLYALEKDAVASNNQVKYKTKAEYDYVHAEQTKEVRSGKITKTPAQTLLDAYRKETNS